MRIKRGPKIVLIVVVFFLLAGFLWLEPWSWMFGQPKIRISPETTYLTEPVRADGTIDYAAALNAKYGAGVTPENNAAVPLCEASWSEFSRRDAEKQSKLFAALGMSPPEKDGPRCFNLEEMLDVPKSDVQSIRDADGEFIVAKLYRSLDEAEHRPWSAEEFPVIDRWLQANNAFLAKVEEASHRTHYWVPYVLEDENGILIGTIYRDLKALGGCRSPLAARAMRSVGNGEIKQAIHDVLIMDRLSNLLIKEMDLISELGAINLKKQAYQTAADIATSAQLDHEQMKILQDFASTPLSFPLAEIMREVERFGCLDAAAALSTGRGEREERSFGL